MAQYSVDPSKLAVIAMVFSDASSDVSYWRGVLAGQAASAASSEVIGSDQAAVQYSRVYHQWEHNLAQLASSLETMALKMTTAVASYRRAESASTIRSNPQPG